MATNPLPDYVTGFETSDVILAAMLAAVPPGLDTSEGSFVWDALAPVSIQLAASSGLAKTILQRVFAQTTYGAYLDLRANEHGVFRLAATSASGSIVVSGTVGTVIPLGTVVSTASVANVPAQTFATTLAGTVPGGGTLTIPVLAQVAGAAGNVAANAVIYLASGLAGITQVSNPQAMTGGTDTETDAALLSRYLAYVRNPPAGGNMADYLNWARAVPGVGNAQVVPLWNGPGTVAVYLLDGNGNPAPLSLVTAVQTVIAPPITDTLDPAFAALSGFGVGLQAPGEPGSLAASNLRMIYNVLGLGQASYDNMYLRLVDEAGRAQAGIWTLHARLKVDRNDQTTQLLEVGAWLIDLNRYATTTFSGTTPAHTIYRGVDLPPSGSFETVDVTLQFAWNGSDRLSMRFNRLTSDTVTTIWLDRATYISSFSSQAGHGLAPVGAQVSVMAPTTVSISVSATLTIDTAHDVTATRAAVTAAVTAYVTSLAFAPDPTVRWSRVATAVGNTPGVTDYASLLVNGGTVSVPIIPGQLAILSSAIWS